MTSPARLVIGTRGSPLALAQAELVRRTLGVADPALAEPDAVAIRVIKTTGDHVLDRPLAEIGGKGLFTKEIEEALLAGTIDLAVHSMKDVPTRLPDGLTIAAVLPRADPRDVLIAEGAGRLADLPAGTIVGTASLRRAAQVLARRPDLEVVPLRGNVQTRLAKVQDGIVGATLLAAAGLARLGLAGQVGTPLSVDEMLPAVAQGAIGVECRAADEAMLDRLARLDHRLTRLCVEAERALLAALDGSCRTPIAALCTVTSAPAGERLELRALVAKPDGRAVHTVRDTAPLDTARELGERAGRALRSRMTPDFFEATRRI